MSKLTDQEACKLLREVLDRAPHPLETRTLVKIPFTDDPDDDRWMPCEWLMSIESIITIAHMYADLSQKQESAPS